VYFAKNVAYFPFNSWLSFQRLCRLLWGLHIEHGDFLNMDISQGSVDMFKCDLITNLLPSLTVKEF